MRLTFKQRSAREWVGLRSSNAAKSPASSLRSMSSGRLVLLGQGRPPRWPPACSTRCRRWGEHGDHPACVLLHGHARPPPCQGGVELDLEIGLIEIVVHGPVPPVTPAWSPRPDRRPGLGCPPVAAGSPAIPELARTLRIRRQGHHQQLGRNLGQPIGRHSIRTTCENGQSSPSLSKA